MGTFDNYVCEGQMDIFDWLQQDNPELKVQAKHPAGEWVKEHGPRVMFDNIQENKYYIADYSTCSNKIFKVVYVMEKTEDTLHYVDEEKGIKGGWKWGNSYSALTRKQWVDAEPNNEADEAYSHSWWYELEEKSQEVEKTEPKKCCGVTPWLDRSKCVQWDANKPQHYMMRYICPKCGKMAVDNIGWPIRGYGVYEDAAQQALMAWNSPDAVFEIKDYYDPKKGGYITINLDEEAEWFNLYGQSYQDYKAPLVAIANEEYRKKKMGEHINEKS